jgi:protein-S-isoprenylcysteine O-methyltransferase Ste14
LPVVALVGLITFGAAAFAWRVWLQYRRTGDTGLRGSARTLPDVLAGLALISGAVAIVTGPILDLTDVLEPLEPMVHTSLQAVAVACFAMGFALTVRAQLDMGASWRIGVDASETTALITCGVFRYVRNPIFTGMALAFAGAALLVPNVVALAGVALVVLGLQLQVRLVEEPYLARVHGGAYRTYARTAGRFIPWLGRAR